MKEKLEEDPSGQSLEHDVLLTPYLNRPQLHLHLYPVWEAFWRLSRRRPAGFAVGAIPMAEFESYCRTFGIDSVDRREWLFIRLDALDAEYMDHMSKKTEKK